MNQRIVCLAIAAAMVSLCAATPAASASKIELRDGWYYVDGQKFLLNAIGYEPGARPGEHPYENRVVHLRQIREDLRRIKAAGFNGIRTWSEMTEPELALVQKSGLKVVFGIWLVPHEDFSDPQIAEKDLALVRRVLEYTRKYDCVITYLIMNEPQTGHIHKVGAQATYDLWTKARDIIHEMHPGVPVTISGNTVFTGWLDMNIFDVYGRNAYDCKGGSDFTHGFSNSQRSFRESYKGDKPSVLLEFGRSVSPETRFMSLYGGNTRKEQADAMIQYYRELLDAGVTGLCPFYYADGWWKGGKPESHEPHPEEWFGFVGFADLQDTVGYPRPAWHALTPYNLALVASPKNGQFYQNRVPVEVSAQPAVKKLRVVYRERIVLGGRPNAKGYYSGTVSFAGEDLQDRELVVEAYDARGRVVKYESIVVLARSSSWATSSDTTTRPTRASTWVRHSLPRSTPG